MPSYFSLLKQHAVRLGFATFIGYLVANVACFVATIILLLFPVLFLGGAASMEDAMNPEMAAGLGIIGFILIAVAYLLVLVLSMVFGSFLNGGLYGMGMQILLEQRSKIGTFFSQGVRFLWRLTGQSILAFLCMVPAYLILLVLAIAAEALGDAGVVMVLPVLALVFLMMQFNIHAPAVLVRDDLRVLESIKQTFRVVFSSFGSSFLSVLLAGGVFLAVNLGFAVVAGVTMVPLLLLQTLVHEGFVVLSILVGIPLALTYVILVFPLSFAAAYLLVLYRYDQFIRPREDQAIAA
ncbi:MAG: hypothetical protein M0Z65_11310 [Firmicutes bacterium]|uniref:Membrane domain of glycerophosphoryl diester phosphodiesterase n=1 Tax=Melghirimyces thermohalophilus TaxID=1236220 RepID=A0A1G6L746_9BACL|nr:hypothetical protein [Melghirimyces thermohalophilus]MDA8353743.1 hypothetical protein [Bacillota bacterium]SDC39149.1 hypothetical protein SAMN04488112_10786 [Melghirimyces thermohalophilus]